MKQTSTYSCIISFRIYFLLGVFVLTGNRVGYAQVFWQEDFATGIPAQWINEDATIQIDSLTGNTIPALWQYCTTPQQCPPALGGLTPFASSSVMNGYVFVDSDALGGNFEGTHKSQLTTAPINCSTQSKVFLQFDSHIGTFNFNAAENALLRVRIGTSGQWHQFGIYPELNLGGGVTQLSPNPQKVIVDLSSVAAGQDSVFLQWQWTGRFELFWALDDIKLSSTNPTAFPEGIVWYEDFSNGLNGWEVRSILQEDAYWEWYPTGNVSNGALAGEGTRINSPTSHNGAAVLNYDFIITGGLVENLPAFPYPYVVSELISPTIDLSEIDEPLNLSFYQLIRHLNPYRTEQYPYFSSFAISRDGGQSWGTPIEVNAELALSTKLNNQQVFPLPNLHGEPNVRLKFTYAGDFYYWVLDDIALQRRPANDLRVQTNFFAIAPNYATPVSQVTAIPFWADILNVGGKTQRNVQLDLTITDSETNTLAFNDVLSYGNLSPDSLAENVIFQKQFTPPARTARYKGLYFLHSDSTDHQVNDNIVSFTFEITDTTFAKENGSTRAIMPSATSNYTYGNVFYMPKGEGWYARYMTFGVANASELLNKSVTTYLYKIRGDINRDFTLEGNEIQEPPLAFNFYTFAGTEDNQLITIPIDLDGKAIPLEDDSYYFVAVEYQTSDNKACNILASEAYNYNATFFLADSLGKKQYVTLLDLGNTGHYNVVGFGFDIVPVIRLHIGNHPDLNKPGIITDTRTVQLLEREVKVFPNPAIDELWIDISTLKELNLKWVEIIDGNGKIQLQQAFSEPKSDKMNLQLSNLSTGNYYLRLHAEKGIGVAKFTILDK